MFSTNVFQNVMKMTYCNSVLSMEEPFKICWLPSYFWGYFNYFNDLISINLFLSLAFFFNSSERSIDSSGGKFTWSLELRFVSGFNNQDNPPIWLLTNYYYFLLTTII